MNRAKNEDDRPDVQALFRRLKEDVPALENLLGQCTDLGYEDLIYRFYHQSLKVYFLQDTTVAIVAALQALAPERSMNEWFMKIVQEGTGKTFKRADNRNWLVVTRPILEAFFHARYLLEMAVKYGKELEYPPNSLPSGWAALLYLYNLR